MTESKRSKLPYALVISLVINALLIGLIIGGGLGKRGPADRPPQVDSMPSEVRLLNEIESRLSTRDRRELRQALRQSVMQGAGSFESMRTARSNLNQLLARDEVSMDEIETALQAIREVDTARREALHTELASQLSQLSLEERQALIEAAGNRRGMRDRFQRRGASGGPRPNGGPPPGDGPPPR